MNDKKTVSETKSTRPPCVMMTSSAVTQTDCDALKKIVDCGCEVVLFQDTDFEKGARIIEQVRKDTRNEFLIKEEYKIEQWFKDVLEDFKIPFDNHLEGMKLAIVQALCDANKYRNVSIQIAKKMINTCSNNWAQATSFNCNLCGKFENGTCPARNLLWQNGQTDAWDITYE